MNQQTELITNNHVTTFHDYFIYRKKLVEYKEEMERYKMIVKEQMTNSEKLKAPVNSAKRMKKKKQTKASRKQYVK